MLVKSAYTGVAASLIAGKTTHTVASLSLNHGGKLSPQAKRRLQAFWKDKTYLIIDEYSMLSKSFLARLSRNISIGKQGCSSERTGFSFGGVNVILCGDLHQFPPVARNYEEHLFRPTNLSKDSIDCQIGRSIYEEFSTVVVLHKQMRITDPTWHHTLCNLRRGQMRRQDLDVLRQLIIGRGRSGEEDFAHDPWINASLVTPRHSVRNLWNESSS